MLIGLIEMLLPARAFKPQLQLITGAVLIITIISQIALIKIPEYQPINTGNASGNQLLLENCAISVKTKVESILKEHNVTDGKIIVDVDIAENNSIDIKSITIKSTADRDTLKNAAANIEQTLDIPVDIGET